MKKFRVRIKRIETYVESVDIEALDEQAAKEEAERLDVEDGFFQWREIAGIDYKCTAREIACEGDAVNQEERLLNLSDAAARIPCCSVSSDGKPI